VRGFWEVTRLSREDEALHDPTYWLHVRLEGEVAAACDRVFTLSTPMADELVHRGVDPARIALLQNACDPAQFSPRARDTELAEHWGLPEDVPVIGYVGSFVQYEGLDDLVEACARLRAEGHAFRLVLVGNEKSEGNERGPITQKIERIAADKGLSDWLIMPGRVPHEQVEAWYSLFNITPFPRKPQPVTEMVTPLKPLEAMAMGKAVVMSSVRAMAEMVEDGRTGLVFKKGDVGDLAAALARLIVDSDLRTRLGAEARAFVQAERTWEGMGRRVRGWARGAANDPDKS
jgi:glycosyltransferase involved in cell wall biosynthesis